MMIYSAGSKELLANLGLYQTPLPPENALSFMTDEDANWRIRAITAIEHASPPSPAMVRAVERALFDPYPDVRQAAARALQTVGTQASLLSPFLMLHDQESSVRRSILSTMARLAQRDEPDAPSQLKETALAVVAQAAMHESVPGVREMAVIALAQFSPAHLTQPITMHPFGDHHLQPLQALIYAAGDTCPVVRAAALRGLHHIDPVHWKSFLVAGLQDPDELVHEQAAKLLESTTEEATTAPPAVP